MKKLALISLSCVSIFALLVVNAQGRPPYKTIIDTMQVKTDAEKQAQAMVKVGKCNACHVKGQKKKVRSPYGMKFHEALDGKNFKFNKMLFGKQNGKFNPAGVKSIRDAINKAGAKKKK